MSKKKKPPYLLLSGEEVAGVTTIKNEWNVEAFKWWGNKLGKQGIDLKEHLDYLANVGSVLHLLGANWFKDMMGMGIQIADIKDYSKEETEEGFECFLKLKQLTEKYKFKPQVIEQPFVSEVFKYGGTPDYVGQIDNVVTLADLKSSNEMYKNMIIQLSGYYMLLKEHKIPVERGAIINCPRGTKKAKITFISIPTLEVGFKIFQHCLEIYQIKRRLK